MIVRCTFLVFFVALLELACAEITGHVKISLSHDPTVDEDSVKGNVDKICLGRLGNGKTLWEDCSCAKFLLNSQQNEQMADIHLPLNHQKVSTHILAFTDQDHTYADNVASNCDKVGDSEVYSAMLPLLFPRDDTAHNVQLFPGLSVKVSLDCDEHYFGPRCDRFCDHTRSGGSFTCHPQTGEVICKPGWIGAECDENVFIDRETASEFLKGRSKRNSDAEECSRRKCTKEELRKEFILRGDVLTDELWDLYNDTNDCEPNPCSSSGTLFCEDLYQAHTCHCKEGYRGNDCSELDMCYFEPCLNGAACEDDGESVTCDCSQGFEGEFCEFEVNYCLDEPCGYFGDCTSEPGGFRCTCDEGFTGERCEQDINDCAENPCLNGGECIDGNNFYECNCEVGYEGKHCESRISPCSSNPCLNGGECVDDGDGGYICNCEVSFEGARCETQLCGKDPCNGQGTCLVLFDGEGPPNFGYHKYEHCECDAGFTGEFCETALSPCEATQFACPSNATCVDLENDYICVCPPGYEGEYCERQCELCEERNEVKCEKNPCQNGARCLAVENNITCICSPGFSGSRCEVKIDLCKNDSCVEGDCITMYDENPGFICDCHEGFAGLHCDEDINECEEGYGICKNGASCDNLRGGFECLCAEGFTGRHCGHEIDPCFSDPCHNGGTCVSTEESFWCSCRIGYIGPTCEEMVNICNDEPSPCQNGGKCQVLSLEEQEINCTCLERYYGRHCERKIPSCKVKYEDYDGTHKLTQRTDCGSYGTCVPVADKFICECNEGYTGKFCDERVRVIECEDVYCKCQAGLTNFKALHRRIDNTTKCNHPVYGSGTCGQDMCLFKPCSVPAPLICKYEEECFEKKISPRTAEANATDRPCPRIQLHFSSAELPENSTLAGVCEGIRNLSVLQPYINDTVVQCHLDDVNSGQFKISAAVASKTSKFSSQMVAIELFLALEECVLSSMDGKGANETYNVVLESLKNASFEGQFIVPVSTPEQDVTIEPLDGGDDETGWAQTRRRDIIIVAVAAAVAIVILAILLFILLWTRRRKATQEPIHQPLHSENNNIPIGSVKWTKNGNLSASYENPLVFGTDNDKEYEINEGKTVQDSRIPQPDNDNNIPATQGVSTFLSPNLTNSSNSAPTR